MVQASASVIIALLMGITGVAFVIWQIRRILAYEQGSEVMQNIAAAIQEGASAFLTREYRVLAIFVAIVATVLATFPALANCIVFCCRIFCVSGGWLSGDVYRSSC